MGRTGGNLSGYEERRVKPRGEKGGNNFFLRQIPLWKRKVQRGGSTVRPQPQGDFGEGRGKSEGEGSSRVLGQKEGWGKNSPNPPRSNSSHSKEEGRKTLTSHSRRRNTYSCIESYDYVHSMPIEGKNGAWDKASQRETNMMASRG